MSNSELSRISSQSEGAHSSSNSSSSSPSSSSSSDSKRNDHKIQFNSPLRSIRQVNFKRFQHKRHKAMSQPPIDNEEQQREPKARRERHFSNTEVIVPKLKLVARRSRHNSEVYQQKRQKNNGVEVQNSSRRRSVSVNNQPALKSQVQDLQQQTETAANPVLIQNLQFLKNISTQGHKYKEHSRTPSNLQSNATSLDQMSSLELQGESTTTSLGLQKSQQSIYKTNRLLQALLGSPRPDETTPMSVNSKNNKVSVQNLQVTPNDQKKNILKKQVSFQDNLAVLSPQERSQSTLFRRNTLSFNTFQQRNSENFSEYLANNQVNADQTGNIPDKHNGITALEQVFKQPSILDNPMRHDQLKINGNQYKQKNLNILEKKDQQTQLQKISSFSYESTVLHERFKKKSNPIAIHIPLMIRTKRKLSRFFNFLFYESIFLSKQTILKSVKQSSETQLFINHSFYIYNLLFISSLLSIFLIIFIEINSKQNKGILVFFYAEYTESIFFPFIATILLIIITTAIVQCTQFFQQETEKICYKSRNLYRLDAAKLTFGSFDLKASKTSCQTIHSKQGSNSQRIKQFLQLRSRNPVCISNSRIKEFLRTTISASLFIAAIVGHKNMLNARLLQDYGLVVSFLSDSMCFCILNEFLRFFIGLTHSQFQIKDEKKNIRACQQQKFMSSLLLLCYHLFSLLNSTIYQNDLSFWISNRSIELTQKYQFTYAGQQPMSESVCPELVFGKQIITLALCIFFWNIGVSLIEFISHPIKNFCSSQSRNYSIQFDSYDTASRDYMFFFVILASQPFFAFSILLGLILQVVRFLIGYFLLKHTQIRNLSHFEERIATLSLSSHMNYIIFILSVYFSYLFSTSYRQFVNSLNEICGPLEPNTTAATQFFNFLKRNTLIESVHSALTYPPLLWIVIIVLFIHHRLDLTRKNQWKHEQLKQTKLTSQVKQHFQQKLNTINDKIEGHKQPLEVPKLNLSSGK